MNLYHSRIEEEYKTAARLNVSLHPEFGNLQTECHTVLSRLYVTTNAKYQIVIVRIYIRNNPYKYQIFIVFAKLAHECKSIVQKLSSKQQSSPCADSEGDTSGLGPLHNRGSTEYSLADSESILSSLINDASSGVLKIADPAVDCVQKLIAHGYLRGEANPSGKWRESSCRS
ncbi:hypothetical protein G4B88_025238 [Cannabis sativa]|uniref:Mon2/Sec7/BIG1-like dimerisation and cyclophilin-binding domain-containing protein n=1 Tax=Cannabis sativa TaxID=3483 RepID=A0A7J6HR56_CANSA|nr:hypothetical protein G4B88_025238 [Cannabis sativa]